MIKAGYDPAHPANLLKDEIEELGLTITEASNRLGITRKHLSNIIHERAGITTPVALAIEQHIGGKAEVWLGMQNQYDLWKLRQSQITYNEPNHLAMIPPPSHQSVSVGA
jgi:addiction module HigA family antidote